MAFPTRKTRRKQSQVVLPFTLQQLVRWHEARWHAALEPIIPHFSQSRACQQPTPFPGQQPLRQLPLEMPRPGASPNSNRTCQQRLHNSSFLPASTHLFMDGLMHADVDGNLYKMTVAVHVWHCLAANVYSCPDEPILTGYCVAMMVPQVHAPRIAGIRVHLTFFVATPRKPAILADAPV